MDHPRRRRRAVRSAGAFLSPFGAFVTPNRTLSDEYHDEPSEPEDASLAPEPEPPGLVRRLLDRLTRRGRPEE